jgi:hypothetical protein
VKRHIARRQSAPGTALPRRPIDHAKAIVAKFINLESPTTFEDLVEKTGRDFQRLVNHVAPGIERRVERLESKLRAALPPSRHADLMALSDAMSADSIARGKAGYIVGIALSSAIAIRTFGGPQREPSQPRNRSMGRAR